VGHADPRATDAGTRSSVTPHPSLEVTMATYRFVTDIAIRAAIDEVYGAIAAPEGWLDRWPDAIKVRRLADGDGDGLGASFDATVRAPMGYRLSAVITTVGVDRPHELQMTSAGDLEGRGTWLLAQQDETTNVVFTWNVTPTPPWMTMLTPVLRPVFARGHHTVVRHAAQAAADTLGAPLLACESREIR
jgi:hypothetical protein